MLRPGATVAAVAPAGPFDREGLERGRALVRSWGLDVRPVDDPGPPHRYLAGPDDRRLAALRRALLDPDVDAVWFARGGYGTARLLAALPWDRLDDRVVIGFSDATALLAAALARGRLRPVHGPVLHSLADLPDRDSLEALRALLLEGRPPELPGRLVAGPARTVRGRLVAGNLAVLASLCGTPWMPPLDGAVLVVEDVGEPAYRLDRALWQLRASGALDGVVGVGVGELVRCPLAPGGDEAERVLAELFADLGVPVVAGLPVGHGARNRPLPLRAEAVLGPGGLRVAAPAGGVG